VALIYIKRKRLEDKDCRFDVVGIEDADSASMSDQPNTKGVFEGNSTLLLDIIKCFNAGIDYAGRTLDSKPKNFLLNCIHII